MSTPPAPSSSIETETTDDHGVPISSPATLILSKNSLRNATYDCDALGIHFRLSTPTEGIKRTRVTDVYRWDRETNEEELVAEWEVNTGKQDRFSVRNLTETFGLVVDETGTGNVERSSQDDSLIRVPRDAFLPKKSGMPLTAYGNRSFVAESGKTYVWKIRPFSLKLYPTEGPNTKVQIAQYKRKNHFINKRNAIIELAPEALEILNALIVTFLYCERGRREQEEAMAIAGSAGGGG